MTDTILSNLCEEYDQMLRNYKRGTFISVQLLEHKRTLEDALRIIEKHVEHDRIEYRWAMLKQECLAQIPEPLKTLLNNRWLQDKEMINELFEHHILGL